MTTTPTPEVDPDTVRLVEDTIDATSDRLGVCQWRVPTADTGPAIVRALVEAGWQPPQQSLTTELLEVRLERTRWREQATERRKAYMRLLQEHAHCNVTPAPAPEPTSTRPLHP